MGEQIPPGGDPGDVLRRSGPEELVWTAPPNVLWAAWQFATQTDNANPGNGRFRMNNADPTKVTEIYLSNFSQDNIDASRVAQTMVADNAIRIQDKDDSTKNMRFGLLGPPTFPGAASYMLFRVALREVNGAMFGNNSSCVISLVFDVLSGAAA